MALAATYENPTSKVRAFMLKGHLAVDTWNMFSKETTRALIPSDQIASFLDDLHAVVGETKDSAPEPSPLKDSVFIRAMDRAYDEMVVLAKVYGTWFDNFGHPYTERQILHKFSDIEVIG